MPKSKSTIPKSPSSPERITLKQFKKDHPDDAPLYEEHFKKNPKTYSLQLRNVPGVFVLNPYYKKVDDSWLTPKK